MYNGKLCDIMKSEQELENSITKLVIAFDYGSDLVEFPTLDEAREIEKAQGVVRVHLRNIKGNLPLYSRYVKIGRYNVMYKGSLFVYDRETGEKWEIN